MTKLFRASSLGDLDTIKVLMNDGIAVNIQDDEGLTALHWACLFNHIDVCEFLLKNGANPNLRDKSGVTCLSKIGLHDTEIDIKIRYRLVKMLLSHEANPNIADNYGQTILMKACKYGLLEIVKLLIESGSEVSAVGYRGNTPLHWTMTEGDYPEIIAILLDNNADLHIENSVGKTALDMGRILARANSTKKLETRLNT